jgi:hypothetical protein
MNYLIINKKNVLEFVYSIDLDAFIKTVLADSDVHLQSVSKCGDSIYVNGHDYLAQKHNLHKPGLITDKQENPF